MNDALQTRLREEIVRRFADRHPEVGVGDRVAIFTCPSGAVGDVVVDVDGPGVIVHVTDMTHGHFDDGGPDEVVEDTTNFLDDLFHDKVVIWSSGSGGQGGWFYRSHRGEGIPPGSRAGTWSGPWPDDDAE